MKSAWDKLSPAYHRYLENYLIFYADTLYFTRNRRSTPEGAEVNSQIARRARAYAVLTIQNVFFTHFIRTARGIYDPHSLRNPWNPRETNYLQRITGISQKFFYLHADIYISHAESTDYTVSTSIRCACYPECFLHTFHPHGAGNLVTRILCVIREIRVRQIISSVSLVSHRSFFDYTQIFIFLTRRAQIARRARAYAVLTIQNVFFTHFIRTARGILWPAFSA